MYPRLWGLAGVDYPALVSGLIRLALERFAAEQNLATEPDAA